MARISARSGDGIYGRRGLSYRLVKPALLLVFALALAGCATEGRDLRPGQSEAGDVRTQMGKPAEVVNLPQGGEVWFYPKGLGRATYRVELGPDGKVRNVDQVLDENHFDRIAKGITSDELNLMLGPPWRVFKTNTETVWEYKYTWGLEEPWTLYVGIGPDNRVTGQHRHQERSGPSGSKA